MTPTAKRLADDIIRANSALKTYQTKCKHKNATKEPKADQGNYCPSDDSFWYVHECLDCGKKWATDQETGTLLW